MSIVFETFLGFEFLNIISCKTSKHDVGYWMLSGLNIVLTANNININTVLIYDLCSDLISSSAQHKEVLVLFYPYFPK